MVPKASSPPSPGMSVEKLQSGELLQADQSFDVKSDKSGILLELPAKDGNSYVSAITDDSKKYRVRQALRRLALVNKTGNDSHMASKTSSRQEVQAIQEGAVNATIFIDDFRKATFQSLLQTLTKRVMLKAVKIQRLQETTNKRTRDPHEMVQLFAALRSLPILKELSLFHFNEDDLFVISTFVDEHPTLSCLHVHIMNGTVDRALLDVMAGAPKLKRVSLDVQKSFALSTLLSSKTLTHVRVQSENFRFKEKHFAEAIETLKVNRTLRSLDLKPLISASDLRAIMFGLEKNHHLETFRFSFLAMEKEAGMALIDTCHSLLKNTNLKIVVNHYAKLVKVRTSVKERMFDLLDGYETLDKFDFYNDEDDVDFYDGVEDCNTGWVCSSDDTLSSWTYFRSTISSTCARTFAGGSSQSSPFW